MMNHQVRLESEGDPFGLPVSAQLTIYGRLRYAIVANRTHLHPSTGKGLRFQVLGDSHGWLVVGDYYPDYLENAPPPMPPEGEDIGSGDLKVILLLCLGKFVITNKFYDRFGIGDPSQNQASKRVPVTTTKTDKVPISAKEVTLGDTVTELRTAIRKQAEEIHEMNSDQINSKFSTWVAVAIEPVDGNVHRYRRVGFVKGSIDDIPNRIADSWFEGFDVKGTIELI